VANEIKAVTFDLWNTLIHTKNYAEYRLPQLKRFIQANNIELDDAKLLDVYQAGFRHSVELHKTSGRRHIQAYEIVEHVINQVGLNGRCDYGTLVKDYEEAVLKDPPVLKDGARETLETLHGKLKIGLISDSGVSPGRAMRKILGDYGVLRFFDATVFSDEVGFCKPNDVIFRVALETLKVKPEEALHVGDLIKNDIQGAKRIGMQTAWLKTQDQEYKPEEAPDYVITGIKEIISILGSK
jgi:putative hydrolase of the HAD superfamily